MNRRFVFDALDVVGRTAVDPEPGAPDGLPPWMDPEPGALPPRVDPEPGATTTAAAAEGGL